MGKKVRSTFNATKNMKFDENIKLVRNQFPASINNQ